MKSGYYIVRVSLVVALGGFLMGFDASVISGVVKFIEPLFELSKLQIGWAVSCLTLTSTLGMILAGPLSDRFGRRYILKWAASFYFVSAFLSAIAPEYWFLIIARMIGGFGVGASLIIAPMYIAELAPAEKRGRLVSFNQLNIVIGISTAFFTNYLILRLGESDSGLARALNMSENNWRWMLGLESLPAVIYFLSLFSVPRSPRWLFMKGREEESLAVLSKVVGDMEAPGVLQNIKKSLKSDKGKSKVPVSSLFKPALRLVITIGVVIAILQQITGINAVFFYAPMIFEQSGIGTNAAFSQAIFVGLANLVFTIVAMWLIDKLGRKPLLVIGLTGIAVFMMLISSGFRNATYTLEDKDLSAYESLPVAGKLSSLAGVQFDSDLEFKSALNDVLDENEFSDYNVALANAAIDINSWLILIGILGFVASFAVSIGPVMWVLFSELFPNTVRAVAVSFVGFINSGVSFLVQLVFPWELANLGSSATFMIFGLFSVAGLIFVVLLLPETKGKSLEDLQNILVNKNIRK